MFSKPGSHTSTSGISMVLKVSLGMIAALGIAIALLLILKPGTDPTAVANAQDENTYAVTYDGQSFSGQQQAPQSPQTVKTQPVASRDSEERFASAETEEEVRSHRLADMPAASTTTKPAAGSASSKEVAKLLKEQRRAGVADKVQLLPDGTAVAPLGAPDVVHSIVNAANAIAKFPYVWGGGHGSFVARGYDCSGSLNYAFRAANLINSTMVSGEYANWGEEGPGKWITIYANGGHVFMVVGGVRYDTSFRDGARGSRWQTAKRNLDGFEVRHPPGL
ncbi:MAG: hypothetical protein ACPHCI_03155 [Solirubrobacterales bacterium]